MIVPFTNLYDEVLPDVPGVPVAVALNAIRNACIEFCDRSKIWVVDHDPVAAIAEESVYQFEPPNGAVVCGVSTVRFDGVDIDPTTQLDLRSKYSDWPSMTGTPRRYLQENTEELILFPKPAAALADALTMKVALKPTRKATGIEGWIVEKFSEELAHGAKAKLFAMQQKPWTSAELSGYHAGKFESAIDVAKLAVAQSLVKARLRTKAQFF